MEDDLDPIEPVETLESASDPASTERTPATNEVADNSTQGGSGDDARADTTPGAASQESGISADSREKSIGEGSDQGDEVPHVEVVSPDKLLTEAPGVSSGARGGFTLPQNPTPTANELLLEEVFGKGSTPPGGDRRAETPPIRIGMPSDSISESRKEGVIPRIVITVSLA